MSLEDGIEMEGALEGDPTGATGDPNVDPNQQQTPDGGQPGEGGQQPVWNGQEWTLKYRGQPHVPKSRDELINLAQKGFSYEQELGKFNSDRDNLKKQLEELQGKYTHYDEFDKVLRSNPALAEKITTLMQDPNSFGGQQQQQPDNQMFTSILERLSAVENASKTFERANADQALNASIAKLKSDFQNYDWEHNDGIGTLEDQVLKHALENNMSPENAFRVMMFDKISTDSRADALKKEQEKKMRDKKAGVVHSGTPTGGSGQNTGYKPGDSYNDLARKMAGELKM